jgi:hypothetical protein
MELGMHENLSAREAQPVGVDNLFSPKCPSGVYVIATILIGNGVMRFLYTPWTWAAVGGTLYVVIAVGLMNLDQWARVVTIVMSILDVGVFGLALTHLRHLYSFGSLFIFFAFLLYASILGYLLMPRIGRAFTRPVPYVPPANSEAKS